MVDGGLHTVAGLVGLVDLIFKAMRDCTADTE